MSAPRYIISLKVGDMTISRKLKTVLGDTQSLQQELALILQEDGFKSLAEGLAAKYGGTEAAQQKWNEDYQRIIKNS
jgi:BRCT domain type II-containing protein